MRHNHNSVELGYWLNYAIAALLVVAFALVIIYLAPSCASVNQGPEHLQVFRVESAPGKLDSFTSQQHGDWTITPLQLDGEYWYGYQDTTGKWNWNGPATTSVTIHCDGISCAQWGIVVYDGDSMTFRITH